jgi:glycosyltransferase involved in cell wall biosynthesis
MLKKFETKNDSNHMSRVTSQKKLLIVVPKAYLPQLTGGLEISANEVAQLYIQQGFDVFVTAGSLSSGITKVAERLRRKVFGGYSNTKKLSGVTVCSDLWHPTGLTQFIKKLNPIGVLFFTSGTDDVTHKIVEANLPTAIFLCGVKMGQQLRETGKMKKCEFVCESSFIAEQAKRQLAVTTTKICPVLLKEKYTTSVTGKKILVVNPNPKKGGAIVLEIAKLMPDRQFLVIGGWQHVVADDVMNTIESGLNALPNIERLPNVDDMSPIFAQSYCLLMPCVGQEAFGRTAAEAQIAGLPVIASSQGALSETVGEGGVTIDYLSPIEKWVSILESLFSDQDWYCKLSLLAKKQASQPARQTSYINDQLAKLIEDLCFESNDESK